MSHSLGYSSYLSWYLWNNDIKLDECLNKLIIFRLNTYGLKKDVSYQLSSKHKLILRSNKDSLVDLRKKYYLDFKNLTQFYIDKIIINYQEFNDSLSQIIKWVEFYNQTIDYANKSKYEDTDSYFLNCDNADSFFKHSQFVLEMILKRVPKTQRDIAKDRIWGYCLRECPLDISKN